MATTDGNELTRVLNSYEHKETILQLPSGMSELGQRNEVEETRDKITHIESVGSERHRYRNACSLWILQQLSSMPYLHEVHISVFKGSPTFQEG
jgi:hypothetical protein